MRFTAGVRRSAWIAVALAAGLGTRAWAQAPEKRVLEVDDLFRIRDVADPQISPDGRWVAYSVTILDSVADRRNTDLWATSWDGSETRQLTSSPESEHSPRWSPDGRALGFLSARGEEDGAAQVWLLPWTGGEARRVTELEGGVSEYVWSPDGKRIALIATDPEPKPEGSEAADDAERPKPIVVDRFFFKRDGAGYLTDRRDHLYVVDLATREAQLLTPGDHDDALPAWSPDGTRIAFVSKRGPDPDRHDNFDLFVIEAAPGAEARPVTTFEGADAHPDSESRPAWSPDGRWLAYLQGGTPKEFWYGVQELAVVPVEGGAPRVLTASLDRNVWTPAWSRDGNEIFFLLEDDRSTHVASVPARGGAVRRHTQGRRFLRAFTRAPGGRVAVLASTPDRPAEVFALEARGRLRPLSRQNDDWLAGVRLAAVDEIDFTSRDGTPIGGFLVKPADYVTGRAYPTILRLHGGPVYQFSNEWDFQSQLFAAHGYAVVAPNPRGSTGRGEAFQMAIYGDWGNLDVQDVLAAVDHVTALGIADSTRLGVGGWSYGGMLTTYVIASDPRFDAAISGAGIANILAGYGHDQYVREYEVELGRPWESTETWIRVSFPFLHADRIVTPTLFLCGETDWNVPLLGSEQMYQALRSLGVETQLVVYPGEDHSIGRPSFQRDRLTRYLDWYGRYLKPAESRTE